MLINPTTDEVRVEVEIQKSHKDSSFRAVGSLTNPIVFEIPAVPIPDVNNDADWSPITYGGVDFALNSDNSLLTVNGALGAVRLHKPAGDNVGVDWKW